ncbi:MAG: hypothetical protein P4L84_34895 [Isosphaeraceae bacterium]|nr:hypothetical protein [Isosphaeraceae bacterium]
MRHSAEPFFENFLSEHLARHPKAGLPVPGTPDAKVVYKTWLKLLNQIEGLSYDTLTTASERLVAEPASERKHFTTLVAFAREAIIAKKPEGKRQDLATREGAEQASKGCDRCGGMGLTTVWRRLPVPERTPATVAAHCVCALGRWMRRYWERDPAMLRRIPDLDDVLNGRSVWLAEEPSQIERRNHYRPF